nr:DNA mismatch repair protein PMS1 isoform X1 [Ipomoea batatas]
MEGRAASSSHSPTIKPINKGVVHRICAGQVILDLSSAVKELVENSLDAGATSIEVALKDYGGESFQVIDNGCGISPHNFKVLALKHHTSKLSDFPDLQSLTTFGFRGEALSSLCALGDLTVETRTRNEPVATHLIFNHSGLLIEETKTARQVGTTVTIKKLFSNLPVRSKEFHRNIRKEYGKLITLLNAYALIAKGVRLLCTNITGRNTKSVVLKTQGNGSLKDNIIAVFGMSTFSCLEPVKVCVQDGCTIDGFISKSGNGSGRNSGDRQFFFVNGRPVDMPKISKLVNELYRAANSKQFPIAIMDFIISPRAYDVNVTPDKRKIFFSDECSILRSLREALEKIYSPDLASYSVNTLEDITQEKHNLNSYAHHGRLELRLKQKFSDGTVPDRQSDSREKSADAEILRTVEEDISSSPDAVVIQNNEVSPTTKDFRLRFHCTEKNSQHRGSPEKQLMDLTSDVTDNYALLCPRSMEKGSNKGASFMGRSNIMQSSLTKFVTVNKRKHDSISSPLSEVPLLRNGTIQSTENNSAKHNTFSRPAEDYNMVDDSDESNKNRAESPALSKLDKILNHMKSVIPNTDRKPQGENIEERKGEKKELPSTGSELDAASSKYFPDVLEDKIDTTPQQPCGVSSDSQKVSSDPKIGPTMQFSFKDLMKRRKQRLARLQLNATASRHMEMQRGYAAASLELSQPLNEEGKTKALAAATSELERLFRKESFAQMKVIGQFNLGFIIGKLDQDLFIVDQHAADEKYNYERLSESTILNQQPLLRPLKMDLSPEEEIVVSMNMDTIRKNGFSLEEDLHAPPGLRFNLKAVPFSKNITFGVADVKELISILAGSQEDCHIMLSYRKDTSDSICPPRVRAMLASRACRSSVMIGDPLGRNEMQKILEHLAHLKSPWNCPHGRPTMRHLIDLTTVHKRLDPDPTL